MDVRAAVAFTAGKPLSIETVQLEGPKDGEVMVLMELPMGEPALSSQDVIHTINGHSVSSLDAFREVYENVQTLLGDDLSGIEPFPDLGEIDSKGKAAGLAT